MTMENRLLHIAAHLCHPKCDCSITNDKQTIKRFDDRDRVKVHTIEADDIADALINAATAVGGPLLVRASHNRVFRRFVFRSNADRVVQHSSDLRFLVFVYAGETRLRGQLQSVLFTPYLIHLEVASKLIKRKPN